VTRAEESNGTAIIDVTDPANPKYLKHLPEPLAARSGGAQMTRVCDGPISPRTIQQVLSPAHLRGKGHEVLGSHRSGQSGEALFHRRQLSGHAQELVGVRDRDRLSRLAVPGWRAKRMTEIYDLKDPSKPVKIRDFGLPGQEPARPARCRRSAWRDLDGRQEPHLFSAMAAAPAACCRSSNREKLLNGPKEPTPANLLYPQISRLDIYPLVGAHTVYPMLACRSRSSPATASRPATSS